MNAADSLKIEALQGEVPQGERSRACLLFARNRQVGPHRREQTRAWFLAE